MKKALNIKNFIIKVLCFIMLLIIFKYMYKDKTLSINLIKYFIFQLLYVLLPGMFIYRLLKISSDTPLGVAYSYGFGVISTIIQYIIFYSINFKVGLYVLSPILSIIEILYIIKICNKKTNVYLSLKNMFPIELIFIWLIIYIITLFGFTLANPMPTQVGQVSYNQDLLWTISNTSSLIRSFPPMVGRISGITFRYHYFVSIHLAVMCIITKMSAIYSFYKFSQIGKIFFLVFSIYGLGQKIFNNKSKALFLTWVFFFTSCASMKYILKNDCGYFLNIGFCHLIDEPFGFELSLAFVFIFISLLVTLLREKQFNFRYITALTFVFIAATGSKGPNGLIILSVLLAVMLINIALKRCNKNLVAVSILISISFFIIYYLLFYTKNANANNSMFFYPGYTLDQGIFGVKISKIFGRYGHIIAIPIHFILFLPFGSFLFILWLISRIKKFSKLSNEQLIMGGMAISGTAAAYLFKNSGDSQLYFIMASTPFIEICALDWLYGNFKKVNCILKLFIVFLFIIGSISGFYHCKLELINGIKQYRFVNSSKLQEEPPDDKCISKYEFMALDWIRNNTKQNCIVAGNRFYYGYGENNAPRYFYSSAITERQQFLEGWEYDSSASTDLIDKRKQIINKILDAKTGNKGYIMQQNKIDYLIISKHFNPDFKVNENDLELVYDNRDASVYKLKR